jgi:hypothetical protein
MISSGERLFRPPEPDKFPLSEPFKPLQQPSRAAQRESTERFAVRSPIDSIKRLLGLRIQKALGSIESSQAYPLRRQSSQ